MQMKLYLDLSLSCKWYQVGKWSTKCLRTVHLARSTIRSNLSTPGYSNLSMLIFKVKAFFPIWYFKYRQWLWYVYLCEKKVIVNLIWKRDSVKDDECYFRHAHVQGIMNFMNLLLIVFCNSAKSRMNDWECMIKKTSGWLSQIFCKLRHVSILMERWIIV